jgi:hypothetical protein
MKSEGANSEMSDRAIAAQIGVSLDTVQRARKKTGDRYFGHLQAVCPTVSLYYQRRDQRQ